MKGINNDVYIHCNYFARIHWKHSTLKRLIYHAHVVCSEKELLDSERKYLKNVFTSSMVIFINNLKDVTVFEEKHDIV